MIAALPMYFAGENAHAMWWHGLAAALRAEGVLNVPDVLTGPEDYLAHWLAPDLLLSQTCGYPLTHALAGKVQLVGTLHYAAAGCDGANYCSHVLVRADDARATLADYRGAVAAFNSPDSQSGFNSFRHTLAPLGQGFFRQWLETGAHRQSIEKVRTGAADIAAIDCVSFDLLHRHEPGWLAGVRILTQTASAPGLPLITSLKTSPDQLTRLRAGLARAVADPALSAARDAFGIVGFEVLPLAAYDVITHMERLAGPT